MFFHGRAGRMEAALRLHDLILATPERKFDVMTRSKTRPSRVKGPAARRGTGVRPAVRPLLVAVLTMLVEGPAGAENTAQLDYVVPEGWVREKPSSAMRYAQFRLPKVEPDAEDASLAVFHFPGGGGSTQDNLDRWIGQMKQPDGSPSQKKAEIQEGNIGNMKSTVLKLNGIYRDSQGPLMRAVSEKPGYRMAAAVLETEAGPFFFKLVGPEKTVRRWEDSFQAFLASVRVRE